MNAPNPYIYIYISEFKTRPLIEFEPLPSGSEKVLNHSRDSTMIFRDESIEMENPWATKFDETPTLESKEKGFLR